MVLWTGSVEKLFMLRYVLCVSLYRIYTRFQFFSNTCGSFIFRCICGECAIETLTDALEYRCCRETQASQKLMFDGSIERVSCITKHDDFAAMNNRSVLLQVVPLLRDRAGKGYRRRAGQTENQLVS